MTISGSYAHAITEFTSTDTDGTPIHWRTESQPTKGLMPGNEFRPTVDLDFRLRSGWWIVASAFGGDFGPSLLSGNSHGFSGSGGRYGYSLGRQAKGVAALMRWGDRLRIAAGPGLYLFQLAAVANPTFTQEQSGLHAGLAIESGLRLPQRHRVFVDVAARRHLLGKATFGPYRITNGEETLDFPRTKLPLSFWSGSAGVGVRF